MSDQTAKIIYLNSQLNSSGDINTIWNKDAYAFLHAPSDLADAATKINNSVVGYKKFRKLLDGSVSLIDEIDSISKPLSSELNYPMDPTYVTDLQYRLELISKLCTRLHTLEMTPPSTPIPADIKLVNNELVVKTYSDAVKTWLAAGLDGAGLLPAGEQLIQMIKDGTITNAANYSHESTKYICKHILHDILPAALMKVYRLHYGLKSDEYLKNLSTADPKFNLMAVPYESADKPSHESHFSDIDLTLILTYLSFLKMGKLRDYDMSKILSIYKSDIVVEGSITNGLSKLTQDASKGILTVEVNYAHVEFMEHNKNCYESLKTLFASPTDYENLKTELVKNKTFMMWYLTKLSNDKTYMPSEINKNLSFVDILSSTFTKTRVGFTGTPSNLVPIDINSNYDFSKDLIDNKFVLQDGTCGEFVASTLGMHNGQKQPSIYIWDEQSKIVDVVTAIILRARTALPPDQQRQYRSLIDVGAFFKGVNPMDLAHRILTLSTGPSIPSTTLYKAFIYVDVLSGNNYKVELTSTGLLTEPKIFSGKGDGSPRTFIYYDNASIIGKDFKQQDDTAALITVATNTNFIDFSQGLYRLRRLTYGQYGDIITTDDMFAKMYPSPVPLLVPTLLSITTPSTPSTSIKIFNNIDIPIKLIDQMVASYDSDQNSNRFMLNVQNVRALIRSYKTLASAIGGYDARNDQIYGEISGKFGDVYEVRGYLPDHTRMVGATYAMTLGVHYKEQINAFYSSISSSALTLTPATQHILAELSSATMGPTASTLAASTSAVFDNFKSKVGECNTSLNGARATTSGDATAQNLSMSQQLQLQLSSALSISKYSTNIQLGILGRPIIYYIGSTTPSVYVTNPKFSELNVHAYLSMPYMYAITKLPVMYEDTSGGTSKVYASTSTHVSHFIGPPPPLSNKIIVPSCGRNLDNTNIVPISNKFYFYMLVLGYMPLTTIRNAKHMIDEFENYTREMNEYIFDTLMSGENQRQAVPYINMILDMYTSEYASGKDNEYGIAESTSRNDYMFNLGGITDTAKLDYYKNLIVGIPPATAPATAPAITPTFHRAFINKIFGMRTYEKLPTPPTMPPKLKVIETMKLNLSDDTIKLVLGTLFSPTIMPTLVGGSISKNKRIYQKSKAQYLRMKTKI